MNQILNSSDLQIEIDNLVNQRLIIENSKLEIINNLIIRQRRGLSMDRRDLLRKRQRKNVLIEYLVEILATNEFDRTVIRDPINPLNLYPRFRNTQQHLRMIKIVIETKRILIKHKKLQINVIEKKITRLPLRNNADLLLIAQLNFEKQRLEMEIFNFTNENSEYVLKFMEIYFS
jgi:hypothetical protein